jgi:hypothetical protein
MQNKRFPPLCKSVLNIAFVADDELLLFKQTYLRRSFHFRRYMPFFRAYSVFKRLEKLILPPSADRSNPSIILFGNLMLRRVAVGTG